MKPDLIQSLGTGFLIRGCPEDLEHRLLIEYWAEVTHVRAWYWRWVPAPPGDDEYRFYLHPAKGPGRGAFWGLRVETRPLTKKQVEERCKNF